MCEYFPLDFVEALVEKALSLAERRIPRRYRCPSVLLKGLKDASSGKSSAIRLCPLASISSPIRLCPCDCHFHLFTPSIMQLPVILLLVAFVATGGPTVTAEPTSSAPLPRSTACGDIVNDKGTVPVLSDECQ